MSSSARDEFASKLQEVFIESDTWLAEYDADLAYRTVLVNPATVLAALVEEHGLDEVLAWLGGERQGRVGLLGIKREWHFLEGDSDDD